MSGYSDSLGWYNEQSPSTNNQDLQEEQAFALEMAQSEFEWLRELVRLLQQELLYQQKQQQELEQELDWANQELAMLTDEIKQMYEARQLSLKAAKEIAKTLLDKETVGEALAQLLSVIYSEVISSEELGYKQKTACSYASSNQFDINPLLQEKRRSTNYTHFRVQFIELGSRFVALKAGHARFITSYAVYMAMQEATKKLMTSESASEHIQQSLLHIEQSKDCIASSKEYLEEGSQTGAHPTFATDAAKQVARQHDLVEDLNGLVEKQHQQVERQLGIEKAEEQKVSEQKHTERF